MAERRVVSVVDDDESVRESLPDFLKSFGFEVQAFESAEAFLESDSVRDTGCLILDVAMPRMTGPDLRRELARRGHDIPAVFITAQSAEQVRALGPAPASSPGCSNPSPTPRSSKRSTSRSAVPRQSRHGWRRGGSQFSVPEVRAARAAR